MSNIYFIKNLRYNGNESPYFYLNRPKGVDTYLLLLFKSKGEITINKEKYNYNPNDIVILKPFTPHIINTLNNNLVHDWIHFSTGDIPLNLPNLKFNQLYVCSLANTISDFIKLLQVEFLSFNYNSEIINNMMTIIMSYVDRSYSTVKLYSKLELTYLSKFNDLRNSIYNNCLSAKTIKEMANELLLSESRFSHLYKKFFNISPIQDIINSKIQHAKNLLLTTEFSVKTISEECGFSSEYIFIRYFKKKVGLTPLKWKQ